MEILAELLRIKREQKMTHREIAAKLGYNATHWRKIACGLYPANDKFLLRAIRAFPELASFLSTDATKRGEPVTS